MTIPSASGGAKTSFMEPTLTVQEDFQGREQERTVILADKPVRIGRAADNDIVLASNFVSGHHARIDPEGNGHRIVDVGSKNGLYFKGQLVQQHSFSDGDTVRVYNATTGEVVTLTYHNPRLSAEKTHVVPVSNFDPNAAKTTIGRENCTINLNHTSVSRFHAQIDRMPDGHHILRDAGSTNGTFVNGQRVTQCILSDGDIIQIGPFKLPYSGTGLDQYDERGSMRIDVRNMTLTVKVAGKPRTILNNISLSIAPREFVALVGGSGAGKSTLMKAISGFSQVEDATVLVNGDDYYKNFDAYRSVLGYVPQDDILHRPLTVGKALDYAARLRLPADSTPQEIKQRIDSSLDEVEMVLHQQKKISSLSGGQRKRVSIAAELLAEPSLFFLDEPTSGLDPGLEKKMMYTMRRLADSGRSVVLVTHATENITQCDHVVFMSRGYMIYFGPPQEALGFFGVKSGSFSDIYTRIDGPADLNEQFVQDMLKREYDEWKASHPKSTEPPPLCELWAAKYKRSPQYQKYVTDRLNTTPSAPMKTAQADQKGKTPRVSPLRQFFILTHRYFDLTLRDRKNLFILLLQAPIIAILLLMLAGSDVLTGVEGVKDVVQRVEAQSLLFVMAIVAVWFGINNAAREITKERAIFRRERLSKLNILSYLFSKISVLGALVLVQNVILVGILMLKIDFSLAPGIDTLIPVLPVWMNMFATMLLTSLAGTSIGLLISGFSSTEDQAVSIVPLILIPQILLAGMLFKIEPEGLIGTVIWALSLITVSRWSLDALGTTFNLNGLCQLPNIFSKGEVKTQCIVNVQDIPEDLQQAYAAFRKTLEPSDAFPNAFSYTIEHLLTTWGVLAAFIVVGFALTAWFLKRQD